MAQPDVLIVRSMELCVPRPRVCIYGAGAIGGSMAVRLARAGADVCVVARGEHGRAINRSGLTLLTGGDRLHARVPCFASPERIPARDIVIVALKAASLPAIAAELPRLVTPDGRIVFAMNGLPWWFADGLTVALPRQLDNLLDPGGRLRAALDRDRVVGCVVNSSNEIVAPGVILNTTPARNRLILGKPDDRDDARLDEIVQLLRDAGYESRITHAFRQEMWTKMLLAVSASPIAALTGAHLGELSRDDTIASLWAGIMREGAAIGQPLGFDMPDDFDERVAYYRDLVTRPSMLEDFERGRAPEIENGILAFDLIARHMGVPAPSLHALCALVRMKARAADGSRRSPA